MAASMDGTCCLRLSLHTFAAVKTVCAQGRAARSLDHYRLVPQSDSRTSRMTNGDDEVTQASEAYQ